MKTTLLFLSVFLSANLFGQNVYIPDANFKAYLVGNSGINTNGDTEIQMSEAKGYSGEINCEKKEIYSLTGIEAFIAIWNLNCSMNYLKTLDISKNDELIILNCGGNNLKHRISMHAAGGFGGWGNRERFSVGALDRLGKTSWCVCQRKYEGRHNVEKAG